MADELPNLTPGEPTVLRDELFVMAVETDDGKLHGLCIKLAGIPGPGIPAIGSRSYIAQMIEKTRKLLGPHAHRLRIIRFNQADECTAGFEASQS